jgi:hypothetical protein
MGGLLVDVTNTGVVFEEDVDPDDNPFDRHSSLEKGLTIPLLANACTAKK